MRICLHLDPSRLLRWHLWLADALADNPANEVSCSFGSDRHPLPPTCRLLLELERLVYRVRGDGATDSVAAALRALARPTTTPDIVINLSGEALAAPGQRVLTPRFNGVPGEIGTLAALANDEDLLVELHDTARPWGPWTARPASADRAVLAMTLDGSLSCAVLLILKALREEPAAASIAPRTRMNGPPGPCSSTLVWASARVASKAVSLLNIIARGGKMWGVGWRRDEAASLLDRGTAVFNMLAADADSYLADPFPFSHRGQDFIFVEQYSYRKKRGCVAVVTVNRDGTASEPRIVLEEPHHLSYPFVFERDGQIWMIPESGAARNVSLYRAVEFPTRWAREACLIDRVEAYDCTPLFREGRCWFFVSPRRWGSTSWDVLDIYRAESLTGPWVPHAANPVLIDASLSRPAGAFIEHHGQVLRPVQDCSRGYGDAVTLCRLDALSLSEFAQTPVGVIRAASFGCHTYNRGSGLEVIDAFGRVRRLRQVTASYEPLPSEISARPDRHPAWSCSMPAGVA
ncbi:hypothetical protein JQ616_37370 [Bradyrhizobium tropiciagri]|uniref:glucosamine inositolphosphorylceramide transferase family protein n=1 Tax=Bradyrhizobium tropiciagri TaxID=312253 RepID=UPI001BA68394|nr:hypothetical protein [Bradyrhizobium tropiciagri]MBR0900657.1 hypothetical protein [Bradyrhizobium tropiciagri]